MHRAAYVTLRVLGCSPRFLWGYILQALSPRAPHTAGRTGSTSFPLVQYFTLEDKVVVTMQGSSSGIAVGWEPSWALCQCVGLYSGAWTFCL